MISKVVLESEELFRMEIAVSNKVLVVVGETELPQFAVQLSFQLETCLLDFLP